MSDVDLKIVLLGSAMVGKTSLLERFINNKFHESIDQMQPTIGATYQTKKVEVNGQLLIMGIWDTAGAEKYAQLIRNYWYDATAVVVCYDITMPITFQKAKYWIRQIRLFNQCCKIYLTATKADLYNKDTIPYIISDVVEEYANHFKIKMFQTSSKTGQNIAELFNEIIQNFVSSPSNIYNLKLQHKKENLKVKKTSLSWLCFC